MDDVVAAVAKTPGARTSSFHGADFSCHIDTYLASLLEHQPLKAY